MLGYQWLRLPPMVVIDSHSHIYLPEFAEDIEEVLERAAGAGVKKILMPNIDLRSLTAMKDLAGRFPDTCFPMIGLHPCSVREDFREVLDKMQEELEVGDYVAIGETGCDMYWDKTFINQQQEALAIQARWAKESGLPLVIHARESFEEIFEVLDSENDERLRGVFHCFSGNERQAEKIASYGGFYYGLGGVLTYKNSGIDRLAPLLDRNRILLETDAPYLTPVPHRGKRNEPLFVIHVLQKLADILHLSSEETAELTTMNTKTLFDRVR
jgi:TatD DNase family protein